MKPRTRWLLAMPVLAALAFPAWADEHHGDRHDHDRDRHDHDRDRHDHDRRDRDRHEHRDFHGRDFRFFSTFELGVWTGGGWLRDWHDGRYGWWWVVDGVWYWYPEPIYPYPTYVAQPVAVVQPPPPPVYQAPPAPPPAQVAPAAQSWYYCDDSGAYYPYVQTCNSPWRQVPAQPDQ